MAAVMCRKLENAMKARRLLAVMLLGAALAGCNDESTPQTTHADNVPQTPSAAKQRHAERRALARRTVAEAQAALDKLTAQRKQLFLDVGRLTKTKNRVETIERWTAKKVDWVDHLARITSLFPPAKEALACKLQTTATDTAELSFRVRSRNTIMRFGKALMDAGYAVSNAEAPQADHGSGEAYPINAKLAVTLPAAKKPAPAAPTGESPRPEQAASAPAIRLAAGPLELDAATKKRVDDLRRRAAAVRRDVSRLRKSQADLQAGPATRLDDLASNYFEFFAGREYVSQNDRGFLMYAAMQADLESSDSFDLEAFEGINSPGVYSVLGWTLSGKGTLWEITDLLYVLSQGRHMARTSALSIVSDPAGRTFDFSVRYESLALVHAAGEIPPLQGPDGEPWPWPASWGISVDLDTPEREEYDIIAARNIFRPLTATPPQPASATALKPKPPAAKPAKPPAVRPPWTAPRQGAHLTLVSGMQIGRSTTLTVRDDRTKQTKTYSSGDRIAGGVIVMLDYRRMIRTAKGQKYGASRVILLIDKEYWAVELGRKFSDMRPLTTDQLPPELRKP